MNPVLTGEKLEKHNVAVSELKNLESQEATEALVHLQEAQEGEKLAFKALGSGESKTEIMIQKKQIELQKRKVEKDTLLAEDRAE